MVHREDYNMSTKIIKHRQYVGLWNDGEYDILVVPLRNGGVVRSLHHVIFHSPTGFCWGYAGSGPADLSLSILCDMLGERPGKKQLEIGDFQAWHLHQNFKRDFVQ